MGGRGRRSRVEPTDEWEQVALLCRWPEQLDYEEIRPLTVPVEVHGALLAVELAGIFLEDLIHPGEYAVEAPNRASTWP